MSEAIDKVNLRERTLERNTSIWISLDWGGLLSPMDDQQEALNTLSGSSIQNSMAISDDAFSIREYQRDKTVELDQAKVDQNRQVAEAKVALGRAQLSIRQATDEYILAAQIYDAKVRDLLMGAREYAAQVELEQLAVEEDRAALAVEKELLRRQQVNAQIYYERIQQAQVEADIARAQVDVAKAHVRAVLADIEAGRADIALIEAQVQKYVAEADKATLQADVATIYAEILTKQLSQVKLDVGQKEIEAGFRYIATKLTDMLALWDSRVVIQEILSLAEADKTEEIAKGLVADKAQEDLKERATEDAREVFSYEQAETTDNIQDETTLKAGLVIARNALSDARKNRGQERDEKQTWAEELLNAARRYVHKHTERGSTDIIRRTEYISGS